MDLDRLSAAPARAIFINGKIYRDSWDQTLPEGAEIYLPPRIPGG